MPTIFAHRSKCLTITALLLGLLSPTFAHARVSVSIGIDLPGPPALVPVPGTVVTYAPGVPANYFFYGGQYYVFANGGWYVSGGYNGPWLVVAPELVPRPILAIPVRYYRARPPAWRGWRVSAPPHWDARWGRGWNEHGRPPAHHAQRHDEHRHAEHRHDERR